MYGCRGASERLDSASLRGRSCSCIAASTSRSPTPATSSPSGTGTLPASVSGARESSKLTTGESMS
eukprot:8048404-Pyramimonas_sp.AAC.1